MMLATYIREFCILVDVLKHHGGSIGVYAGHLKAKDATLSNAEKVKSSHDKALAIQFMKNADQCQYGALWEDLTNQFSQGNNQYPKDLMEAHVLLVNFKQSRDYFPNAADQQMVEAH